MPAIGAADIKRNVDAILIRILEGKVREFKPSDRIREDLGLDSLHSMELLSAVTEKYDLDVELEDVEHVKTIGDLLTFLEKALNPR